MREILFRGKRVDDWEWIEGGYVKYNRKHYIISSPNGVIVDWIEVDPATVGQYTGLKDKNGKRIFEGDICRFKEWNKGKMCWVGEVLYEHQQFIISGGANEECELPFVLQLSRFIPECIEVIGNVHDNPELIGGNGNDT